MINVIELKKKVKNQFKLKGGNGYNVMVSHLTPTLKYEFFWCKNMRPSYAKHL
jgi:hypothetical protein